MKDTLRQKSGKTGSGTEFDITSQLREPVSPNPWTSETPSTLNGDTTSRQISKASKTPHPTSPIRNVTPDTTQAQSQSPPPSGHRLEVPSGDDAASTTDDPAKPARRRKTVTKTPHTFELEADLNPVKPKEQCPPTPMETPKQEGPAPIPKKKKRASQPPPADPNAPIMVNAIPSIQQTPPPSTPPPAVTETPVSTPRLTSAAPPPAGFPTSPKPTPATVAPVNPFTNHRPKKSLSASSTSVAASNPCRFTPPPLPKESFYGKVIVLTHGASQTGQALVRQFHAAGSRVIFGDTNSGQARKLISSLGPPHVVHFNKCDMTKYSDILDLFKLATTMYGRVDHAVFGVGDDGGQAVSVGEGEKGWFEDRVGVGKTFRTACTDVESEPPGLGDVLTASVRFARIAMAYLKYSPKSKNSKKSVVNPYSTNQPDPTPPAPAKDDRSLTLVTSISAFKETPLLPIYQVTQHAILGLVRSLRTAVDPDPERDGVRINAVATNIMVPRANAQSGGRMSVQLPPDRPDDVARVIVGVVATNSSTSIPTEASSETGLTHGSGIWYEKGLERGMREKYLHGRVIYSVGVDCWDVQEGLDRSEPVWIGSRPAEVLAKSMSGLSVVDQEGSSWILDHF
ncbi:uncharacterized protein Z518_06921 [Rhinocladiella mackenziei CBS 650.93]|uniref:Uncharacterized protein n=1 Tax=Rhinocladiella mackenziei CBS 650.93 TaxID=1442369 RepID=A0A0D2IC28_9EURO|nr:uncharacterized protein Z518_06921 [Rhinocladiella mackenziei CBS 650.93]KIX03369.1 hypothetical protein Z518_06921 [Rhinocladiella mackenziei CBS 650.93]